MKRLALFACAAGAMLFAPAHATIVGGDITGGTSTGSFVELTVPFTESNPDNTVGNNTFQDPNLYAFNEGTFVVAADLALDFGGLIAGETVQSHYVFFDPAGTTSVEGYVDFAGDIIAVAVNLAALTASDIYGAPSVMYLSPALRGLEPGDTVALDGLKRLLIDWTASTPGDFIRVFTKVNDVPLPAAAWVFLAGLGGIAARLRRKKA
ncbi:MAG: VPLPA-CTERM sorting domain-containing protein [Parvularculaceae bacterium]